MSRTLNILLVEDNDDDEFLMREAFKKASVDSRLIVVPNGTEAIKYLKHAGSNRRKYPVPDIMLLDLSMPQVNGFEVLEWLRKDPRHGRIVSYILTGSAREADVDRAYMLGANGYVLKPNRMDDLIAMIAALHNWHRYTLSARRTKS